MFFLKRTWFLKYRIRQSSPGKRIVQSERTSCPIRGNELQSERSCPFRGNELLIGENELLIRENELHNSI